MVDITLDVKGNDDLLKLDWRSPTTWEAGYQIGTNQLIKRSSEVRACLQNVIDAAMENQEKYQMLRVGLEMKELARAGKRLRDELFFSADPDSEREALEAEEWLGSLNEAKLHVTVDRQIYIPWGLVYDGDPESLKDDAEDSSFDKFRDFWCVKYQVSTLYNRIRDRVVRNPRMTSEVTLVKLTNKSAWDRAILHVSPLEQTIAASMFNSIDISSRKEFERIWKTEKKSLETDLLYFFGHASGTDLAFANGDTVTMDEFPRILRRSPPTDRPACLVFLNGCHTAIGDRKEGGFLQATAAGGFCGFVGTESEVPDVFALRFANAFLSRLLHAGMRALDAMSEVRRAYWPLSLAYNLSCHPEFRFITQTESTQAELLLPNFSTEVIGSERV
jgi:hypothetical protein